jgi:hypothetical protein
MAAQPTKSTTAPKSKPTNGAPPAPAQEPTDGVPAVAQGNRPSKPHSNSTRDNSFLKWKPSTLSRLQVIKERFPETAKECDALIAKVMTLPDNFSPNENVKLEVGDIVRLPEHDSMLKALKLDNRGKVMELSRGTAKVQVGSHSFTVVSRDVELIERGNK